VFRKRQFPDQFHLNSHAKLKNSYFSEEKSAVFVFGVPPVPTVFDRELLHCRMRAMKHAVCDLMLAAEDVELATGVLVIRAPASELLGLPGANGINRDQSKNNTERTGKYDKL
jgi:hypothetical protein